ncbi:LysM domain protein [Aspergillus floccosus]
MHFQALVSLAFLFRLGNTAVLEKRFTGGASATGTVDPNVASDCTYWVNSVTSGDTCQSVADYFGLSVGDIVSWNPSLSTTDCTLNQGWSYCVEAAPVKTTATTKKTTTTTTTFATITSSATQSTTQSTTQVPSTTTTTSTSTAGNPLPTQAGLISTCNALHLVESGDYCQGIQTSFGNFTLSQFYSWNPSVKSDCTGLQAGYYVCIGVGGSTAPTTTTTTAATTTSATNMPQQTGIASTCNKYHLVSDGDTCDVIVAKYGIALSNFYAWNPAIGSSCSSLWLGYYVCAGVSGTTTTQKTTTTTATTTSAATGPLPTQSGINPDCTTYYKAQAGDSCWSIVNEKYTYLSSDQFIWWNPAVGGTCTNLQVGYYYCVATNNLEPMPNTIGTCKKWYLVASGDSCWSIQQKYGITAASFNQWNSYVGSTCSSLWLGYYVCVGV